MADAFGNEGCYLSLVFTFVRSFKFRRVAMLAE
jgi:hypothetical protein